MGGLAEVDLGGLPGGTQGKRVLGREEGLVQNEHADGKGATGPPRGQQVESNIPWRAQDPECHLHVPVPAVHGPGVAF